MVKPEKPLKKKDQIALDEELALRLHAKEQAELEKERVAQEEASRAAIIEELDSIQAMIEADEQLASRLQAEEQEQFSIEEKSRMLVEMIAERKKFFAAQRAAEKRRRSYEEIQKFFDKAYKQKQKIDEHVEAEKDDDQEEAEMKRHIEIVKDDEVAIDAIPLATKPPMIVEYKIDKDGRMGYFKLIRADGSSKRPKEDYERVLCGDLKVMFEPDIKSEIWRNLQGYEVTIWKLFDTSKQDLFKWDQQKLYCNYLKNMEGYTLKQLKGFKFEVFKDIFNKAFKRVNTFVDYKTELVKGSEKRVEDSTKRAGTKLEQEVANKQKIDDAKIDDDQEEAEMKKLIKVVPDEEEVAMDAIPLATKPLCIVD
ncbi:hypothetical protein Tco_0149110 [Tanacetum coccineum]